MGSSLANRRVTRRTTWRAMRRKATPSDATNSVCSV